uniref:Uncharacterized protein n=1 Tax=Arundo donax TaxID=35708 RepID=A0A0A9EAD8_ARUDO
MICLCPDDDEEMEHSPHSLGSLPRTISPCLELPGSSESSKRSPVAANEHLESTDAFLELSSVVPACMLSKLCLLLPSGDNLDKLLLYSSSNSISSSSKRRLLFLISFNKLAS